MKIKRDEMDDLEALLGIGSDIPKPDEFDLGAPVVLNELSDDELLFRESVIKTFFENATRAGHPVYGFNIETLQRLHEEVVTEFKKRGRDYKPALDRHQKETKKDVKRNKDDEITVRETKEKSRDEQLEEIIEKTAEKTVEKIIQKQPVNIPTVWMETGHWPKTGDVYYGHNYTTCTSNNPGGDVNDEKETVK